MSELYAMVDGAPKLIAKGGSWAFAFDPKSAISEGDSKVIPALRSFTIACHMSAKAMREFAKVFAWSDRMTLHRRRAIAKARGKNWRNVR